MSTYIYQRPPNVMNGSIAPTGVQVGKPVVGSKWVGCSNLVNYLLGHGGTLVTANTAGSRTHAAGSSTNYRYYIWPRYQAKMHLWSVTLLPDDEDESWGDFDVNGTKLGEWSIGASNATVRTPSTFFFWDLVTQSATATSIYATLDVDSGAGAGVIVHEIACYEAPRATLLTNALDLGAAQETCAAGKIIRTKAVLNESIYGPLLGSQSAYSIARRNGHFHWFDPDGVSANGTSYQDVFVLYPEALGRSLRSGDGAGQTQGRTLEVAVYGYVDGAESVANAFKTVTASGNSAAVTITSTLTWYGPFEIDVDCEDLTATDGRRDATWETLQHQFKEGENNLTIYGISVGEP